MPCRIPLKLTLSVYTIEGKIERPKRHSHHCDDNSDVAANNTNSLRPIQKLLESMRPHLFDPTVEFRVNLRPILFSYGHFFLIFNLGRKSIVYVNFDFVQQPLLHSRNAPCDTLA